MNHKPLDLSIPDTAGIRSGLLRAKHPQVAFGLMCPIPGFLLLQKPMGLFVYIVLIVFALTIPTKNKSQRMRLPPSLILAGLLVFVLSDHHYVHSDWFLSGILPFSTALIAIDWVDQQMIIKDPKPRAQTPERGKG